MGQMGTVRAGIIFFSVGWVGHVSCIGGVDVYTRFTTLKQRHAPY